MQETKLSDSHYAQKVIGNESEAIVFRLQPNLQHMTLVTIARQLWYPEDVQLGTGWRQEMEDDHVNLVFKKIYQLPAPISKMLKKFIEPMGSEIYVFLDVLQSCVRKKSTDSFELCHFMKDIIMSPTGKINITKTVQGILSKHSLSDVFKFELACYYCLEEEINNTACKFSIRDMNYSDISEGILIYWSSILTGDTEELEYLNSDLRSCYGCEYQAISIHENLFYLYIEYGNFIAARYMWDKLNEKEKADNIVRAIGKSWSYCGSPDLMCFILSQADYEQQRDVLKIHGYQIFSIMLRDWLWKDYFLSTVYQLWDEIDCCIYIALLKEISEFIRQKQDEYKIILKELWQFSPGYLKHGVLWRREIRSILRKLSYRENMDIVNSMLSHVTTEQNKNLLPWKLRKIQRLIINEEWDILDQFVEHAAISKDIAGLKTHFVEKHGTSLCIRLMKQSKWEQLEKFLHWSLKTSEKIDIFRRASAYEDRDYVITSFLGNSVRSSTPCFGELELFLKWCFLFEGEVLKFKTSVFKRGPLKDNMWKLICELIEEDQFQSVDEILNWCFLCDKSVIKNFKMSILSKENQSGPFKLMLVLMNKDDGCRSLNKFVLWCGTNEVILKKYKMELLAPENKTFDVCGSLVQEGKFKLADEFISWCGLSETEIKQLKNKFMLENYCYFFYYYSSEKNYEIPDLLEWLNPSEEIVKDLIKLFDDNSYNKWGLKYIDEFLAKRKTKSNRFVRPDFFE